MKQIIFLTALLFSPLVFADFEEAMKSGDFKEAYNEALREFRTSNREAQSAINVYERVHKNITFQSNELLCRADKSESHHHACLLFTKDREMKMPFGWERAEAGLVEVEKKIRAHYEKLIDDKSKELEAKIKADAELKIAACTEGKTADELSAEMECLNAIAEKNIGDIFSNKLYQKYVTAGPFYSVIGPRINKANSARQKKIAAREASPEGKKEALATTLCRAYWLKMNSEKSIASEREVGRSSGFVNANHLHQKGTDLRDAKREIASTEPAYKKLTGKKFVYEKECKDERDDEEPEHE
jgi:hypothetical protein